MADQAKRAEAIRQLQQMQQKLHESGETRYPRRSDFSDAQAAAIKAQLGPWPRALEAADLKPPRTDTRHRKTIEKRLRTKADPHTGEERQIKENGGNQS